MNEMWGVTAYFNPTGYSTKLRNLESFAKRVREQGLKLLIAELAFSDAKFAIPPEFADQVLQLRSNSVLWQKERILNLAIEQLPESCDKVTWLDGDILFTNDSWVVETSRLLEKHKVVQPYELAAWLPAGGEQRWQMDLPNMTGVAFAMCHASEFKEQLIYRPDLVHPGFGWAARREILSAHGLYDKFILGGGDFVAMLAMYCGSSALSNPSVAQCLCRRQTAELGCWMDGFYHAVAGDVGYTTGSVLHLWHGNLANRGYIERYGILREFDFDPKLDIARDENGCWAWSSDKPELHRRVEQYFASRKEDG
jgi:hypothetical protein